MTTDAPDATDAAGPGPGRRRTSIAERAARRAYLETHGRDRYDSLLRHLRAGRELPVERSRRFALDWHPIAGRLLVLALAVAVVYVVATAVAAQLREARTDTWSGTGAGVVESGQRLAGCPAMRPVNDPVFPNWIRFDGGVFHSLDARLPVGPTNIGDYYLDSGYTLGDLRIFRVALTSLGPAGSRILVRSGDAPAGELYARIDGCS